MGWLDNLWLGQKGTKLAGFLASPKRRNPE
ncbi:hypothetical protein SAMN05216525_16115 [Bradyrhizobium sp. Gha]|nr:hypothetical protein SAMN05216525_16115 [Bradyrhizobium sp. Gha]